VYCMRGRNDSNLIMNFSELSTWETARNVIVFLSLILLVAVAVAGQYAW